MKRIVLYILMFSFMNSVFAKEDDAYKYLQDQYRDIETSRVRALESYKRIYKICSRSLEITKLQYAKAAAAQVLALSSGSESEIKHIIENKKSISQLLYNDLESEGFFQAIQDCRYTPKQTRALILSLIILDTSGKILGGVGVITFFKVVAKAVKFIKYRYRKLYYGLIATGIGVTIYDLYKRLFKNETIAHFEDSDSHTLITSIEDLKDVVNDQEEVDDLANLSMKIISSHRSKVSALYKKLDNDDLSTQDTSKIEERIRKLNMKIQAIELTL